MRLTDKTDTKLVLTDTQADKRFALTAASVFLAGVALFMAWEGFWELLPIAAILIVAMYVYRKRSAMTSTLTLDRAADSVVLVVDDRNGRQTWDWNLSDIETAEISTVGATGTDTGTARPQFVLKDGTRVPMRPYHAAGGQSWHAVAAVKLFLGQDLDDAPVGWITPTEFDELFAEELKRHYK
ncbi:hypothetical protein [Maritimibacter sp. UBA3975]|uniref:hypothetical protein n=1 Tax=Maritimibacter sp. UBA3975 TaxID=1946833 RepID=UPI000C0B5082|nr:hypothetical protein [Maritimibacter sp. UBA3975]MAM61198.1 hypothetical protein [Maritimibacter sp.]|tara:strand:+ start:1372 stop:1920 length:549 start_codon:yes stop_codon:yes gene_type:complete